MPLTIGFVTDLHFGPETRFEGKLRKLTSQAPALTDRVVDAFNDEIRPDVVVNLGDDIEDVDRETDLANYSACQRRLARLRCEVIHVAGNHDIVHLKAADLNRFWRREGSLHYAWDFGGVHFVVLHSVERQGVDVSVAEAQVRWLREDLARATGPVLVFVHHSLSNQDLGDSRWFHAVPHLALVRNREEVRAVLEESGKVRAVFNGHVHRNHLDVIHGIPYVTFQSLIENLDEDTPGRVAGAFGVARVEDARLVVRVHGADPARYQVE